MCVGYNIQHTFFYPFKTQYFKVNIEKGVSKYMLEIFYESDITDNLYIPPQVKNAKYSLMEKKKFLEEAIKNGGYYGDNGCWNSILVFDNDKNIYRGRVETLVIKDDKYMFFLPNRRNNARK